MLRVACHASESRERRKRCNQRRHDVDHPGSDESVQIRVRMPRQDPTEPDPGQDHHCDKHRKPACPPKQERCTACSAEPASPPVRCDHDREKCGHEQHGSPAARRGARLNDEGRYVTRDVGDALDKQEATDRHRECACSFGPCGRRFDHADASAQDQRSARKRSKEPGPESDNHLKCARTQDHAVEQQPGAPDHGNHHHRPRHHLRGKPQHRPSRDGLQNSHRHSVSDSAPALRRRRLAPRLPCPSALLNEPSTPPRTPDTASRARSCSCRSRTSGSIRSAAASSRELRCGATESPTPTR